MAMNKYHKLWVPGINLSFFTPHFLHLGLLNSNFRAQNDHNCLSLAFTKLLVAMKKYCKLSSKVSSMYPSIFTYHYFPKITFYISL